ncbi:hypothetical protein H4W32_000093 [Actinophytocola algeriensis]|uniref:Uncharacterized protein n=1 Tax=Actinophytocola algeriensis TaxID=1768010 RepID=A0A7W7Q3H8_9PSEU|nr:hypothetical protein [Actinophytocola algeriensis]MBE1472051.1 hypothetical protein [Actinophytocola algeriensis]
MGSPECVFTGGRQCQTVDQQGQSGWPRAGRGGGVCRRRGRPGHVVERRGGKTLAFLAAVAVGMAPLATNRAGPRQIRDWTRLRSVSEELKSETYTYLARVAPTRTRTPRKCCLSAPSGSPRTHPTGRPHQPTRPPPARSSRGHRHQVLHRCAGRWSDRGLLPAPSSSHESAGKPDPPDGAGLGRDSRDTGRRVRCLRIGMGIRMGCDGHHRGCRTHRACGGLPICLPGIGVLPYRQQPRSITTPPPTQPQDPS